jgi:hypothetical protein
MRINCLKKGVSLLTTYVIVACSSTSSSPANGSFPAAPVSAFASDSGHYQVKLWTAPTQPPSRGINEVKLEVTDAMTTEAADNLAVVVVPWMPAMGHGTSIVPTVSPQGRGIYIAQNVDFYMPSTWQLRLDFAAEAVDGSAGATDSATPTFDIP